MILTVIRGKEQDLQLAGIAAAALCGARLAEPFGWDILVRPAVADRGSLQVMCDINIAPRVRAGLIRAGFDTIEPVSAYQIPAKSNVVSVSSGPEDRRLLQMADPAADALCGAGLTVPYDDGRSYSGDLFADAVLKVQCDQSDVPSVQMAFNVVWKLLAGQ
jgi:hypothetical protein